MNILAVNHITINVTDLEKSKIFYSQVLGLKEAGFIHMGDHTLTYYTLTPQTRLELIKYLNDQPEIHPAETTRGIYRHFCLETDDLDAVTKECQKAGISITKEAGWVEKLGCNNMLLIDPNGIEIELISR